MRSPPRSRPGRPRHRGAGALARGVALLDALAACLVLALGLQALLWFQLQLIGTARSALAQLQATRLAEDLFERLQGQPVEAVRAGLQAGSPTDSGADCRLGPCLPAELRAWHLGQWQRHLSQQLPLGAAEGFAAAADPDQLGLRLDWRDAGFGPLESPAALQAVEPAWPPCPPRRWCHWVLGVL